MVSNAVEGNEELTWLLCKLLYQQGEPKGEIESLDRSPINYQYFKKLWRIRLMIQEGDSQHSASILQDEKKN